MLPVQQRLAPLLNLGLSVLTLPLLDLLTGESHFLSFTGQVSSAETDRQSEREIIATTL